MPTSDEIRHAVVKAIDALNELRDPENQLSAAPDTRLIGDGATIDSLAVVNLILEMELSVEHEFDVMINLSGEEVMDPETSPLSTIHSLENYIGQLIQEAEDGR